MATKGKILFVTIGGSRGDVQPYVAAACGLARAGYETGIVTHSVFADFVHESCPAGVSIEFFGTPGDPRALLSGKQMKQALYSGSMSDMSKAVQEGMKEVQYDAGCRQTAAAARKFGADAIITSITTGAQCVSIGHALMVPVFLACTGPFYPSRHLAPIAAFDSPFSLNVVNAAMQWMVAKVGWSMFGGKLTNDLRTQELHLPALSSFDYSGSHVLNMFSALVQPSPPDWPSTVHTPGYWILPATGADLQVSDVLRRFIDADPERPPVYLGFGSMPVRDAGEMHAIFRDTLKKLKLRGIFCSGWNDQPEAASEDDGDLLCIASAPHEWLLPRCAMAIHHGGAGTFAASARAGVPTLIFPLMADQPYWAKQAANLGIGPKQTVSLKNLTRASLEEQIRFCLKDHVKAAAVAVGAKLRDEDGVAATVAVLDQLLPRMRKAAALPAVQWVDAGSVARCTGCDHGFGVWATKRNCNVCGGVYCANCARPRSLINYAAGAAHVCTTCRNLLGDSSDGKTLGSCCQ